MLGNGHSVDDGDVGGCRNSITNQNLRKRDEYFVVAKIAAVPYCSLALPSSSFGVNLESSQPHS